MNSDRAIRVLREIAAGLGPLADGTAWYLFGSVSRDDPDAADVDVMIICRDDAQADQMRNAIDLDALGYPLDLSLMTFAEEQECGAVARQNAQMIFPGRAFAL